MLREKVTTVKQHKYKMPLCAHLNAVFNHYSALYSLIH